MFHEFHFLLQCRNKSNEAWIFNITANAEHPEVLILTAVFTFDIRDRSDKQVLDHIKT